MTIPTPSFRCELRRDNGITTVVVEGELEEISAVQLAMACLDAHGGVGDVALDLGGVTFVDGTGVRMLETLHRACERSGHAMKIRNASSTFRREVKRLELDGILRIETGEQVPDG